MAIVKARIFTDLHEDAIRPAVSVPDIYIDNGAGGLNAGLSGLTGWSGLPTNVRAGWNSRSISTLNEWTSFGSPSTSTMRSISIVDVNNGWAVGDGGALWKLESGVWTSVSSPSTSTMLSISIVDVNNGWAVGVGGLWKLESGVWISVVPPNSSSIYSISIVDINNGWAVGSGGALWKLESGAWTSVSSPSTKNMRSVSIVDSNNGWAVGDVGALWKLEFGAWTSVSSPNSLHITSISLIDVNNGWAVGEGGALWKLESGAWTSVSSPNTSTMRSVSIVDINNSLAVGDGGASWKLGTFLKTGKNNTKRSGWFYVNYDNIAETYAVANYNGSQTKYIIVELLNAQDQTGTQKWIKWFPFTNVNGYPTSINYNLGGGVLSYCAWGIEYQNEDINGYIQNQRLVLIRDMDYPVNPSDTVTNVVDELSALTSVNVGVFQYSVIQLIKNSDLIYNNVYSVGASSPNYSNIVEREATNMNTDVLYIIFANYWCEGGILGLGGSGSIDGNGLIDNIGLRIQ